MPEFAKKRDQLLNDLLTQGERVVNVVLRAVECYFSLDVDQARAVIAEDEVIDRIDVQIEKASIPLLALGETDEHEIRSVLTIVKINNELERIADCAVNVAEVVLDHDGLSESPPATFRVMANSVVGMVRDAVKVLADLDVEFGQRVLAFDDTIDQFKRQILLDAQERVADGSFSARFAFRLMSVTKSLERMADHCTNICEQVIYLESGLIVRHQPGGWSKPIQPS